MTEINKIKEYLKTTGFFDVKTASWNGDNVYVNAYPNCIIVEPLTAEAERKILLCPYTRTLRSSKHLYALYRFPQSIEKDKKAELPLKFRTRLDNLLKSRELGQIQLYVALDLPPSDILKLKFTAKPYKKREDYNYRDDQEDTACKQLATEPKTYNTIEKVSLTYNTFIILHNAKEYKNKSLFYYLQKDKGTTAFYTDCIINYILEHSKIISPENLKYPNPILEVRMPVKEFKKLFPSRASMDAPKGVEVIYSREGERLSKKDTVILKFSEDFIKPYKDIIKRTDENVESPKSFIKVPMFFILEALKKENLGANGFQFLLWFLPFYRMKDPIIYYKIKTIMVETGMDIKHGYNKPLNLLQKYFDYLQRVGVLANPLDLKTEPKQLKLFKENDTEKTKFDKINEPPKYNNKLIKLRKPKKPKSKD